MPKKILIATGGTGGHIYPAMALAQQFTRKNEGCEILFVGGGLAKNHYFDRAAFNFRTVDCGAFISKSPVSLLRSCLNIAKGIWQSRKIMQEFKPDVAVGFGSYYSFPPLIAAKMSSVPVILHEANSIPGKVNKLLSPFALATGVHFPQTLDLIKGNKFEVGMPLRNGFHKGNISSSEARKYFGLSEEGKILLVFGGSQGAKVINGLVQEALEKMNEGKLFQIIHIVGDQQQIKKLQEKYKMMGIKFCVKAFEERMEAAWQAADLVISRSGASSIAEQLEFEVPGILIPYSKAADDHQNHNADFLVDTVGGAKKMQEKELTSEKLAEMIFAFIENEGSLLKEMALAMKRYKKTARILDLYSLITQIVSNK